MAAYIQTLHLTEKEDLLQIKSGWTDYLQMDRLQHSTVIRKEISRWTKNGMSTVLTVQSKVLQARMDVYLARWHTQKEETEAWQ